jgi:cysteine desulfurase family protein
MVYLDAAATTLQKPASVYEAVRSAMKTCASPGRGGYAAAGEAARVVFSCREKAAEMFGAGEPENVVFTLNATHALNIAIKSLVSAGSRAVVSGFEHNAVMRPLNAVGGADICVVRTPPFMPDACLAGFDRAVTRGTAAAICTHVSNVFGCVQPIDEIAEICRSRGVPLIVDAAQSAGTLKIDIGRWGAAFVAMPGHKGLYGPQGTGMLLCAHGTKTLIEGGTGSMSAMMEMPDFLPDRLEAGTQNVPGIAGLGAGMAFVKMTGEARIAAHERAMMARAAAGIRRLPRAEVFAPENAALQSGALSFRVKDADCESVAEELSERGIAVRAGLHCAPLAHETAGTEKTGTVRISASAFTTSDDIDYFIDALREISS